MIEAILADTVSDNDIETAQHYDFDERKKLLDRLIGTLEDTFNEVLVLDDALADVKNAIAQARPVFAAGLSVDQSLGFIVKQIQESLSQLEEIGEDDSEEYEKQELVLEKLNGFIQACEDSNNVQGEEALETIHLEYRGELGALEALKNKAELGIGNSIGFLKKAYGDGGETDAFVKGLERRTAAARYIAKFGSQSFFLYKHVMAPGEVFEEESEDPEGD